MSGDVTTTIQIVHYSMVSEKDSAYSPKGIVKISYGDTSEPFSEFIKRLQKEIEPQQLQQMRYMGAEISLKEDISIGSLLLDQKLPYPYISDLSLLSIHTIYFPPVPEEILVCVEIFGKNEELLIISIADYQTVSILEKKIRGKLGIFNEKFLLFYDELSLQNEFPFNGSEKLSYYGVKAGCTIQLRFFGQNGLRRQSISERESLPTHETPSVSSAPGTLSLGKVAVLGTIGLGSVAALSTLGIGSLAVLGGLWAISSSFRSFVDLETNQFSPVQFSSEAEEWRQIVPGTNVEGFCRSRNCEAYQKCVIAGTGYGQVNIIEQKFCCPICWANFEPITCGFAGCEKSFVGKKAGGNNIIIGQYTDVNFNRYERISESYHLADWTHLVLISRELLQNDFCIICMKSINDRGNKFVTDCGHTFHFNCIEKFCTALGFMASCPICGRTDFYYGLFNHSS